MPAKETEPKNGVKRFTRIMKVVKDAWWLLVVIAIILGTVISYQIQNFDTEAIEPLRTSQVKAIERMDAHIKDYDRTKDCLDKNEQEIVDMKIRNAGIDEKLETIQRDVSDLKGGFEELKILIIEKMR